MKKEEIYKIFGKKIRIISRKLSDVSYIYEDKKLIEEILKNKNPLIYEVFEKKKLVKNNDIISAITIIKSGKIGKMFFATKGHKHDDTSEVYMGLKGKGILLLKKGNKLKKIKLEKNKIAYVPPKWAHRTINNSNKDFVFLAIYPSNAKKNYNIKFKKKVMK